jgi:hypothetical protein
MTSDARSEKAMELPPGFFGMLTFRRFLYKMQQYHSEKLRTSVGAPLTVPAEPSLKEPNPSNGY